ncbi:MAG: signal peptide peptidase SppA [Alistipes sp.]|jgi:protease-4|nr:signal peptide peptidase SppA [Alistipes sp.]
MNFFKTFLAALLAVVVGTGFAMMLGIMTLAGMAAMIGSKTPAVVPHGAVLRLDLGQVSDSPQRSPLDAFDFMSLDVPRHTPLLKVIRSIDAAAEDPRIEGLYLNFGEGTSAPLASLEELRARIVKFKESGKFVVAYQENWGQVGYWFASVADSVYTNPAGSFEWTGLSLDVMFYKGLLDKLGVEPVVVRHGSFKSAIEPYILDRMSPENRLQYERLAGSIWGMVVGDVAAARGVDSLRLIEWADNLEIHSTGAALERGLVDGVVYEDQVMARMKELTGGEKDPTVVSLADYMSQTADANIASKNKIALIYAEGEIVSGSDDVGSVTMVDKIRRAREDKDVKAVVLRVNSPGGSALAAEVMWRELELLRAEKPLIVSMGATAASGGYYIAAPADAIYADRSTLTGSIGVFGLFFNAGDALRTKLGVTTDVVTTNRHSDIGSPFRSPRPAELAYLQKSVEDVYATFVGHVAEGRNMIPEAVDKIGQGRVWTGVDALGIGLIDGHGGLVEALSLAADRVGVADDFRVWEVTDELSPFEALLGGLSAKVRASVLRDGVLRDELGAAFRHYEQLRGIFSEPGVQARLPYVIEMR